MSTLDFPDAFTWGVATSAFQIEGAAFKDGRSVSIWDTFCRQPGRVFQGHTGDVACDHYHRYEQDLDLVKELGVSAYRFSVAWPRVIPRGYGKVNAKGLDYYDRLVDAMLARGLAPYCTLYHWDLPQVLEDKGGWLNRDTALAFQDYSDAITGCLGDRIVSYATLNEPWCSAFLGYFNGHHAPGHRDGDTKKYLAAVHHLLLAHGLTMPILRSQAPQAELGIVLNLMQIYPDSDSSADEEAAKRFDTFHNQLYLEPLFEGSYPQELLDNLADDLPDIVAGDLETIAAPLDFLGQNYYTPAYATHDESQPWPHVGWVGREQVETTAMGWEVDAQGLEDILVRLHQDYKIPLWVMENGAAYEDTLVADGVHDHNRVVFYQRHLAATAAAIEQGADVRGYFAWSLMDNFEWAFGYSKRFGLIYVDFETQERILKDSATWYRDVIREQKEVA